MLRRNGSVNVPTLAAAYVQSFQGQLLLNEHAPEAATLQGQSADQEPPQQDSSSISTAAASEGADEQQLDSAVSLKTFKDLLDDLRSQLKEINGLDDKVWPGRMFETKKSKAYCLHLLSETQDIICSSA